MLSNFKLIEVRGRLFDKTALAEVDYTTGALWWKRTARRMIGRKVCQCWCFVDTGKFTPGYEAEALERAWEMQNGAIFP